MPVHDDQVPEVSRRVARILELDRAARAVEFDRVWHTWGDLDRTAVSMEGHVASGDRVGLLLRNRPPQLGLLVGLLRAGACIVAVNPDRGTDRVRADVAGLGLQAIAGDEADLSSFAPGQDLVRLSVSALGSGVTVTGPPAAPRRDRRPGVAVEMLTSGTTGPPKRVPLTYETFDRVLAGAKYYERDGKEELKLRSGVAIVNAPLVHLGGLFRVLQCLNDGRSFCLLERFRVHEWVDAVRRHRPRTASLVPAALRMVLEADPDPEDLSSLRSVVSGTAPLSPDDADAFFARYGIPVLVSYAATEFGGGVAGWNLADHQKFWSSKRGSVGRAHPGCELRVVDVDSGTPLPAGREGLLEIRTTQLGDDSGWTRTTDLARLDEEGFLWILGRADQAIIRGGFKVLPDDVRVALERDPRVRTAAVVGRDDPRLGSVPVAAVEIRSSDTEVTADDLLAAASKTLARYELPAEIIIVDELPRTPSGKVELAAVRRFFTEGRGERKMRPERWRFGVEPLSQTRELASLMRQVAGLAISLEYPDPVVDRLIYELRSAEQILARKAPADPAPRVGPESSDDRRVYVDHSQDIGMYNPCFPEYVIDVTGDRAAGTVAFPLAYEGPPGVVHGGFLAVFFDCVIQHHNCEVGQAGKTVSLAVSYNRPTPLLTTLDFEVERALGDRRITSSARLLLDGVTFCSAAMDAVVGERSRLPEVSSRRPSP